jgi:hypothetical protein
VFERRTEPFLSRREFVRRMLAWIGIAAALIAVALLVGVLGYHWIAGFGWVDSILNASMILSAMGPVDRLTSDGSKLFASAYALFSGVVFVTSISVVLAPIFHRVLHHFHLPAQDGDQD